MSLLETVVNRKFRRFLRLFWPIFEPFFGGSIRNVDTTPEKRLKNRLKRNLKSTEISINDSLLEVENLTLSYSDTFVFEGLSFSVERGEIVGLIGPSGSGKSSSAQAILRLPMRQAVLSGKILFEGEDLLLKSEREMRHIRGRKIGMIFQDPASSLNPTMKIGPQIAEGMIAHRLASRKEAKERTLELLSAVQLPPFLYHFYPHQLSGGMRQRVMIAIALASSPSLLIADEPTSALDASTTGEILSLLKNLQKKLEMGLLLITHDPLLIDGFAHRSLQLNEGRLAHAP